MLDTQLACKQLHLAEPKLAWQSLCTQKPRLLKPLYSIVPNISESLPYSFRIMLRLPSRQGI